MTKEQKEVIQKAVELVMPEAIELKKMAEADKTTKDGYGVILSSFIHFNNKTGSNRTSRLLTIALLQLGYPKDTIATIWRTIWI